MKYRIMNQHLGKASGNHAGTKGKCYKDEAERITGERAAL